MIARHDAFNRLSTAICELHTGIGSYYTIERHLRNNFSMVCHNKLINLNDLFLLIVISNFLISRFTIQTLQVLDIYSEIFASLVIVFIIFRTFL